MLHLISAIGGMIKKNLHIQAIASATPPMLLANIFQAGVLFFHRERERDCFEQSLFRQHINANPATFVMKLQDSSSQISNAPSHVANTPS